MERKKKQQGKSFSVVGEGMRGCSNDVAFEKKI